MNKAYAHRFPPMSLLVLAALARREGWDTRIIDEAYEPLSIGDPGGQAPVNGDERPDLVAITVWTAFAPRAYQLADAYREAGVPVVLGGVHASMLPSEAGRHADAVVGGEAELVLGSVLDDVLNRRLQPYYRGEWSGMVNVPMVDELAPVYARFPYGRYQPTHTVQSTRGCRFNCEYCSVIRINGRGTRHAEIDRVVEDLRFRTRMRPHTPGPIFVFFLDDDLASDLDYVGEFCEAIASADLGVRWSAQASIGLCRRPDLVELAARSGCRSLFCGFESVSRSSLIEANKKNRPDEYAALVATAHEHGISIEGSFIFGFDDDTPDVFDETVDALDEIGVDMAHFFLLTPFPGTQTFARYFDQDRILDFDWGRYDSYTPMVRPAHMTPQELREGLHRAYRAFYSPARQRARLLRGARQRETSWSIFYALINRSYGRLSKGLGDPMQRRQPPFTADPADLERALEASRAEPQEAIAVAARMVGASSGALSGVPVSLPSGRPDN